MARFRLLLPLVILLVWPSVSAGHGVSGADPPGDQQDFGLFFALDPCAHPESDIVELHVAHSDNGVAFSLSYLGGPATCLGLAANGKLFSTHFRLNVLDPGHPVSIVYVAWYADGRIPPCLKVFWRDGDHGGLCSSSAYADEKQGRMPLAGTAQTTRGPRTFDISGATVFAEARTVAYFDMRGTGFASVRDHAEAGPLAL